MKVNEFASALLKAVESTPIYAKALNELPYFKARLVGGCNTFCSIVSATYYRIVSVPQILGNGEMYSLVSLEFLDSERKVSGEPFPLVYLSSTQSNYPFDDGIRIFYALSAEFVIQARAILGMERNMNRMRMIGVGVLHEISL